MQQQHPFPAPIPGHQGPPASATPITDYTNNKPPGLSADGEYLVLPHRLLDSMELPWQQQFGQLLQHYAQRHARAPWPQYQVRATRPTRLTDCSEEQLAEVDAFAEYTDAGELVYRDARTLQPIEHPAQQTVHVSCPDPLITPRSEPGASSSA